MYVHAYRGKICKANLTQNKRQEAYVYFIIALTAAMSKSSDKPHHSAQQQCLINTTIHHSSLHTIKTLLLAWLLLLFLNLPFFH